ncbi:hypothetical protein FSP39_016627 [Pinctada imbricata]|uniref:EF-hand domain-containing protein n=1 Tax=Pinctada imbricata TaxID=66713 RepID=A0AA89BYU8_PINIB|nr:hypothetical protein FSP39_016627 [Pinctada imbricata]
MQRPYAEVRYVCSRITIHHNSRVELKWKRSLHHCAQCDVGGTYRGWGISCGAIHYGRCTPVTFPFPQNYNVNRRKGNGQGVIPVAKVIPTRSVRAQPEEVSVVDGGQEKPYDTNKKSTLSVPNSNKDGREIIPKDSPSNDIISSQKDKGKENKELSPSSTTATPTVTTITISDKKDKTKKLDINKYRNVNSASIPKFYFPYGRPATGEQTDSLMKNALEEIAKLPDGKVYKHQMGNIVKACNLPLYWKALLFHASGGDKQGYITQQSFTAMWKRIFHSCHDEAARFVKLSTKPGCSHLTEDDFLPLVQDVVDTHPGLTFLREAPEFHSRYVNTVIARIFYNVNRSWNGKITITELRKSNFLQTLALLEQEDDINVIVDFFSYEHFYVIYCKFWELDKDHDLYIDKADLARHNDHAMSMRVIDRIFSGSVMRGKSLTEGKMSYPEFVWFLISEEDKKHPTSVEYWFRCMDIDGDGVISMYEMEFFYEEQMQKMESMGIEKLPFEDCLCQMLDLVRPREEGKITLADLKNCKMTNIFFDTFLNLDKFLEHEQRDPFSNIRDLDSDVPEPSDWEKYAAEEYEILLAEEGANEQEEM